MGVGVGVEMVAGMGAGVGVVAGMEDGPEAYLQPWRLPCRLKLGKAQIV